jgi:2-polyprenyl-3-methyl-5-hydroxy-6-metoxy-1,4-benzoquinol methylase
MDEREFDYQWKNLKCTDGEYTQERRKELLDLTKLKSSFFMSKLCLDAGCGNGRYTYAMLQLDASVESIDISPEAIKACKQINPNARVFDIMNLQADPKFDFVFCWGVLHHLKDPRAGFIRVASQVKPQGILHIMVYNKKTQKTYEHGRQIWGTLSNEEKLKLCREMMSKYGGHIHGWWDAYNPQYNWSFEPKEIKRWFEEEGFRKIKLTKKYNINMRGVKKINRFVFAGKTKVHAREKKGQGARETIAQW